MNSFSDSSLPYAVGGGSGRAEGSPAGWVAGRSIIAYGVRIGIRTNKPEFLDRILGHAPPLWKPTPVAAVERLFSFRIGRSAHSLLDNQRPALESRSLKEILGAFEVRLKMHVAEMARRRVFVHAGVVGWRGKAIVVPGLSMSGKTSLVVELVQAGATYYSDEYAVLDGEGRVHPYPQPLAIRKEPAAGQKRCPVEEIGGTAGSRPLAIGMVVATRYKADACWRPAKLSAGMAVLEMLANTIPARRKPEVVIPTLQRSVMGATALKGARGDAEETARLILRRFDSE